jgi:endonuclease/exonuclease/phosphatase family metal-dependent hydrolase
VRPPRRAPVLVVLAAAVGLPSAQAQDACRGLLQPASAVAECGARPGWELHEDPSGERCCLPRALSLEQLRFLSTGNLSLEEVGKLTGQHYPTSALHDLDRIARGRPAGDDRPVDLTHTWETVGAQLDFLEVRNLYADAPPARRIRVGQWNMERGQELEQILQFLGDPGAWAARYVPRAEDRAAAVEQAREFTPDILIVEELDRVTCRTGYRDAVAGVAARLRMNYAFLPEFLEIDPKMADPALARNAYCFGRGDSEGKRNLEGQAIFSRYPIVEARLHRFAHQGYDWYLEELRAKSEFHKTKYAADLAKDNLFTRLGFQDPWDALSQLRLGSRGWIEAVVRIPTVNGGSQEVKVIEAHLEARGMPKDRAAQMEEITTALRNETRPVIVAGDWNSTNSDGSRVTIWKGIKNYAPYLSGWLTRDEAMRSALKTALTAAFPGVGWAWQGMSLYNIATTLRNPARAHVPLFLPNKSAAIFEHLEEAGFEHEARTNASHGHFKWLGLRTYDVTFSAPRTYGFGLIGTAKLDWIMYRKGAGECLNRVKDSSRVLDQVIEKVPPINDPATVEASKRLGPMSDHMPQIVDFDLKCGS